MCARFVRRLLNSDYIIWSLSHGHSPVLAGMVVNSTAQAQVDNKGPCWFTEEAASVKPQEQVAGLIIMFIAVDRRWFLYISAILFDLLS